MSSNDLIPAEVPDEKEIHKLPLVVIVGPTAVGKSDIAIQLAKRLGGEIISADSRLFYRGMDIGTAKPSFEERQGVPHHLIDVANPDETWSLAIFQKEARQAIREIVSYQHLPFLVGGTGQFIRAVSQGWSIPAVEPNPRVRLALEHWSNTIGSEQMHARLAVIDPSAADAIDHRNVRRTVRALEVIFSTGRRFSELRKSGDQLFSTLMIGLDRPRDQLYERIDTRIETMISSGMIDEVKRLLDMGYSAELPTMSAIGYAEIISYLQGSLTLDEAVVVMKRRTRNFVRRQANWFKKSDPEIHWFEVGQDSVVDIEQLIRGWLH